ncbi:diversity-generating retroelement protein Avd [Myxococcota bacterium]|nr:diversity-generating retroelement protein Avd [Myxococcota bacterium]
MKQSPIFIKSYETLQWILERTRRFPAHQRFVMAKRIEEAGLSFHDCLIWATKSPEPILPLREADFHLERLRVYNRLCMNLKLLSFEQYEFLARALDEIGRLLGGWLRSVMGSSRKEEKGVGE